MKIISGLLLIVGLVCAQATAANATPYVTLGAGWFDFNTNTKESAVFSAEWKGNSFYNNFVPIIGANVNTDGGLYGYGGVAYDWQFAPNWFLTPGLAAGLYSQGNSKDLGGAFEFHEELELSYKFDSGYRIGAEITHTSNASIYDSNPGVNTLMATFSLPLPY